MAHRPIPGIHDSTRLIRTAMVHLPRRPTAWGLGRTHLQGHCKVWLHADANPSLPLTGQRNLAFHGASKRSPAPTGLLHKLGRCWGSSAFLRLGREVLLRLPSVRFVVCWCHAAAFLLAYLPLIASWGGIVESHVT